MTNDYKALLKFSKQMQFPENLIELVSKDSLLDVRLIAEEQPDKDWCVRQLKDWEIISFDSEQIKLGITFSDPIEVSQSAEGPDKLLVQIKMS